MTLPNASNLLHEIRTLVQAARTAAARQVNVIAVLTNFEIGRRIVLHEQGGEERAAAAEQQGCQQRGEAGTDHRDVSRFFCHHALRPRV